MYASAFVLSAQERQVWLVFAVVVVSAIGFWVLSRCGPRGAVLIVAAALYAAGAACELRMPSWLSLSSIPGIGRRAVDVIEACARQGGSLRAVGFVGLILGVADLGRQLLRTLTATTGAVHGAGGAPPLPGGGSTTALRTPGPWAAVAWCLVLVSMLQLLPGGTAEVVVAPRFRHGTVVHNWRGGGYHADRAMTVDFGRVRSSIPYSQMVAFTTALALVAAVGIACLLVSSDFGPEWRGMAGLVRSRPVHLLAAGVAATGLFVVVMGGETLMSLMWGRQFQPASESLACTAGMRLRAQWSWPVVLALVVVVPAICEELWFRAYIGRGLVERCGTVPGVLVTSFLFALVQLDPRQMIVAFFLGLVLHWAFLATKSLRVPILLHMAANFATAVMVRSDENVGRFIPLFAYAGGIGLLLIAGMMLVRTGVPAADAAPGAEDPTIGPDGKSKVASR